METTIKINEDEKKVLDFISLIYLKLTGNTPISEFSVESVCNIYNIHSEIMFRLLVRMKIIRRIEKSDNYVTGTVRNLIKKWLLK